MLKDNLKLRSFLFVPAHNCKFIEKIVDCSADGIILDVEDGVPPVKRAEARENIRYYHEKGLLKKCNNVFIRINPIETEEFIKDIDELTLKDIDGFMPSKISSAKGVLYLTSIIDYIERKKMYEPNKFKLAPLIETAEAVENVNEIAKTSQRVVALCFGGEDYLNDLGSIYTYQESAFTYPRAKIVNAARANNILPIDTPYLGIKKLEDFEKRSIEAYKNGFAGGLVLSPRQIEIANKSFTPDEEKVSDSRRVIDAVRKASESGVSGVAMLEEIMVGPPMRKRAENVLRQIGEIDEG